MVFAKENVPPRYNSAVVLKEVLCYFGLGVFRFCVENFLSFASDWFQNFFPESSSLLVGLTSSA